MCWVDLIRVLNCCRSPIAAIMGVGLDWVDRKIIFLLTQCATSFWFWKLCVSNIEALFLETYSYILFYESIFFFPAVVLPLLDLAEGLLSFSKDGGPPRWQPVSCFGTMRLGIILIMRIRIGLFGPLFVEALRIVMKWSLWSDDTDAATDLHGMDESLQ